MTFAWPWHKPQKGCYQHSTHPRRPSIINAECMKSMKSCSTKYLHQYTFQTVKQAKWQLNANECRCILYLQLHSLHPLSRHCSAAMLQTNEITWYQNENKGSLRTKNTILIWYLSPKSGTVKITIQDFKGGGSLCINRK